MAVLFAEDFKGYGDQQALMLNGLWGTDGLGLVDDPDTSAPPDPVTGSKKVAYFAGYGNGMRRPFAKGAVAVAGVAYRLWLDNLPGFTTFNARMLDGGNGCRCSLAITPTGVIQIYNGNGGAIGHGATLLGSTAAPVLTATAWHHIEFKVDTGAGTAEARVDGVSVLQVAGDVGTALQLGLGTTDDYSGTAGVYCHVKDLVMWDGSGGHNNDFLGTVSVLSMWTDSDVNLGWTTSTGTTGWNLLDKAPPIDDTDYIFAPFPAPPPSTFTLSDLPLNVSSVKALITQVRARKSDGGDGNIQASLISAGSEVDGSNRPITTAFTYYEDVFETDPHSGGNWSVAAADAAEFKINRTV